MNNLANILIENYVKNPNKVCLVEKGKKYTYSDLYKKVINIQDKLYSKGLERDNKVLVLVPMSVDLYATLIAVWSIGAIPCFMDVGFIRSGMYKNDFNDINAVVGISKYIWYSNLNSNLRKLKVKINVNKIAVSSKEKLEIKEIQNDYPAILTYTSGTTGKPKIAARSHEFLKNQGKILENLINYEKDDIELSSVPIFTLSNINVGITTVITDGNLGSLAKSKPEKVVKQMKEENINRIMAAPGLLNVIIKYAKKNNLTFENVRKVFTGGGAIFNDYILGLREIFPNAKIETLYGSTEAEPIALLDVDDITEKDIEKTIAGNGILAGKIVGVKNCKIINYDKKVIGTINEEEFKNMQTGLGEIVVTGDNVLKTYVGGVGNKENKFTVDKEVYHRTGDLGSIDSQGRLWLRGRIKEPYFNIEAALHILFDNIGKTAVFKNDNKLILVLENKKITKEEINKKIQFTKIDEVMYIKKIPVDKRHNAKVDYKTLKEKLKID